jgi:DnaJ family protein B protein 12
MTDLAAIPIIGLDRVGLRLRRLLVDFRVRLGGEGLCSMLRYHRRSCLIGSSAVVVGWVALLVGPRFGRENMAVGLQETGGGGGMFDTGPQFVFNLGGGPGFRVHQFGGGQPRRRPRAANGNAAEERPQSTMGALSNLLPLLILFVLPLLSSLFSSAMPSGPSIHFQPGPPNTMHKTSHRLKVNYYLNPDDLIDYTPRKLSELDKKAETQYVTQLQYDCQIETRTRNRMVEEAQGWFFQDVDRMREARNYEMRSCQQLDAFGFARSGY